MEGEDDGRGVGEGGDDEDVEVGEVGGGVGFEGEEGRDCKG